MNKTIKRKGFLLGAAAACVSTFAIRPARAVQKYVLKFGNDIALNHPTTQHVIAAGERIKAATNGTVEVQVFPNNALGDNTHMLAGVRSGAIQMMSLGDNILATLVPSAAIANVGFAFKDSQTAWNAMDGSVGELVRADIEKTGLHAMRRVWDLGFREITSAPKPINAPDDLRGFKIRVPPSPISLSIFKGLGAAPGTLDNDQLYTALQTKVFEGQENSLGYVETDNLYQVQKYCSLTDHMWVGYWILVNGAFWKSMPAELQEAVADGFNGTAPAQRTASAALNNSARSTLEGQGVIFNTPDKAPFRAALVSSGFYEEWQTKFGSTLWSALEQHTGPLS
jgi:tripartite ATP-independent transporter DctP family solute receptor